MDKISLDLITDQLYEERIPIHKKLAGRKIYVAVGAQQRVVAIISNWAEMIDLDQI